MKNFLNWLPMLGMLLLVSCDEILNEGSFNPGDLPGAVTDYIQANYGSYDIDDVDLEDICDDQDLYYEVELEDGNGPDVELYFSLDGEFVFAAYKIGLGDLPQDILNAIQTEFPGFTLDDDIKRYEFDNGTIQYEVEFQINDDDDLEVIFNADGSIVCQENSDDDDDDDDDDDSNDDNGNDDNSNDDNGNGDDSNSSGLPDAAFDYIQANYSGYDIEEVEIEDICDDQKYYEVELEDGPGPDLELYFTLAGEFRFAATDIEASAVPQAVRNAIAAQFPGYEIEDDDIRQFEYEDGSLQFEIELEKDDDDDLEVVFNADGSIFCQEKDDDD